MKIMHSKNRPTINHIAEDFDEKDFQSLIYYNNVSLDIIQRFLTIQNSRQVLMLQEINDNFIEKNADIFLNKVCYDHIACFANISKEFICKYYENLSLNYLYLNEYIDYKLLDTLEVFK